MRLYNTLSRRREELTPKDGAVNMYVCGITPYAPSHVGHAMSYVIFDVVRRYLEFKGFQVRHVQNFTDVEDKIIQKALRLGLRTEELAKSYIQDYFEVMDALNIKRAHVYPRATQEIPAILEIIIGLVDKGYAYAANGDVYFRVQKYKDYGKLSHRTLEGMMAGARIEVEAKKEYPMDFTLWKEAKPGEPSWDSPWGMGRPGWHIECSAMSHKYLGDTIDIHGGGQDLVFPHHENEIAQTEAYTGVTPFARFWLHNGLLRLEEEKMSKSQGNFITVREVLSQYSPDALRLFFLSSHYRSPLIYSEESVSSQERASERLRFAVRELGGGEDDEMDVKPYRNRFLAAMDDDLNTPQALASLFDLARDINRRREEGQGVGAAQVALRELAGLLGLTLSEPHPEETIEVAPFVELLMETRSELRNARRYDLADKIRNRLAELGVTLEDTPRGTEWKYGHP